MPGPKAWREPDLFEFPSTCQKRQSNNCGATGILLSVGGSFPHVAGRTCARLKSCIRRLDGVDHWPLYAIGGCASVTRVGIPRVPTIHVQQWPVTAQQNSSVRMPELPGGTILNLSHEVLTDHEPEVERAAALIRSIALGKRIVDVDSVQDDIVYSGITHTEFVRVT